MFIESGVSGVGPMEQIFALVTVIVVVIVVGLLLVDTTGMFIESGVSGVGPMEQIFALVTVIVVVIVVGLLLVIAEMTGLAVTVETEVAVEIEVTVETEVTVTVVAAEVADRLLDVVVQGPRVNVLLSAIKPFASKSLKK
ncbi:uncharacterized protein PV09_04732 [Verruconis gallopava]|uniref:Uncharacterized protein n=1 Tax=Verruconis gallopava TaxID=253628 RepID=A0A0D1YV02_9PEZI|nr:uncharacterized protein PV09_04732 [Verruconis gallopava]KIW04472.1 hypothetical protein PV09_04732 [Verruconis gallopava]